MEAYATAGLGPEDIDVVELHDADAGTEIISTEELGLCEPGEGGQLVASGATALGGRIPVNASGGLLSKGAPVEYVREPRLGVVAARAQQQRNLWACAWGLCPLDGSSVLVMQHLVCRQSCSVPAKDEDRAISACPKGVGEPDPSARDLPEPAVAP